MNYLPHSGKGEMSRRKLAELKDAQDAMAEWGRQARCRQGDVDPEIFFEYERGSDPPITRDLHVAEEARQICFSCPVRPDCFAWAQANPWAARYGMWGGYTASDRQFFREAGIDPDELDDARMEA